MDLKYDILHHPSVRLTTDGIAEPYIHGEAWDAGVSIELAYDPKLIENAAENTQAIELPGTEYVLLAETELEEEIKNFEETAQTGEKNPEETELIKEMMEEEDDRKEE